MGRTFDPLDKAFTTLLGPPVVELSPLDILLKAERPLKTEELSKETDGAENDFTYKNYMGRSKGVERADMPQVPAKNLEKFVRHFDSTAKVKLIKVPLNKLKPTQGELNEDKILDRIQTKSTNWKKRKYIMSLDGYLLDGHHDWAHGLEEDPTYQVEAYRVNVPIDKLLARTKRMKISHQRDINDKKVEKAWETIQYVLDHPEKFSIDVVEKAKHIESVTVHRKGKTFQRKQMVGTDKAPKQPHWFAHIHKEHQLSKVPIGVPREHVHLDLEGDIHSKAVMKWKDPKTGKPVRAYTSKFMEAHAQQKWKRVVALNPHVDQHIIKQTHAHLSDLASPKHQSNAILAIIAHTGLRPGNRRLYAATKNRGISTLGPDNVSISGDTIKLNFTGKSYKNNKAAITDPILAKYLTGLKKKNKGKEFLFDVTSTKLVDYIMKKEMGLGGFKIKDLRTFKAAKLAYKFLHSKEVPPPPMPEKGAKAAVGSKLKKTFELVSEALNNTPSMAKKSYVPPMVIENWMKEIGFNTQLSKADDDSGVLIGNIPDENLDEYGEERDQEFTLPDHIYELIRD